MTTHRTGWEPGPAPRVVVVVGTDHHPFDRLITWVNGWLEQHPEQAAGFFVQSGTASIAPACSWSPSLDVDQLDVLLDSAEVMICHGGPASIANAWSRNQLPIVVPRLCRLGEHVDDHQLDFCREVAELGRVRLAETWGSFTGLLEEAARDIGGFRAAGLASAADEAVARFATLVDELVSRSRRRPPGIRLIRPRRSRRPVGGGFPAAAATPSPGPVPAVSTIHNASSWPANVGLAGMATEENE